MKKRYTAGQATDDNIKRRRCIGSWTPKATHTHAHTHTHTHRVCNPYCFSNARVVERKSLNVTLICTLLVSFISTRGLASINYLLKQRREGQNVPASHTVPILSMHFTVFVYMQAYICQHCNLLPRQTALLKDTTFSTYRTGQGCSDTVKPAYK